MIDPTQILLFTVVTSLTVLLIIIGIQVFLILKEVKKTVMKFNRILDDTTVVSGTVSRSVNDLSKSVSELSGFASGIKTAFKFFHVFNKKEGKHNGSREK